jgi:outer membrane protein TolC
MRMRNSSRETGRMTCIILHAMIRSTPPAARIPASCLRFVTLACCAAALAACATFSEDGGFGRVSDVTHDHLGRDVRWPRTADERARRDAEVASLMSHPLDADDAVQIALLNNHDLQAAFQELGISEADLVQSGRLPNPRITLRHSSANGIYDIEQTVTVNVVALLTAPYLHATEKRRFAEVQDATVIQVVTLADRTRTAYYRALAARDSLQYAGKVRDAAQTGAELARRMQQAGNWNRLDQAREQSFYWEAMQSLSDARLAEETARATLRQILGVADEHGDVVLAEHLPELPQTLVGPPDLDGRALQNRIDLKLRRTELDELARRLKLVKTTRFVNVLDAGPTRVREGTREDPYLRGYEVSFEIPLFDTGDARVRKSEALYAQAAERFAQEALDARAEVVKAAATYRQTFETAIRQRDDIMPAQTLVAGQDLLRYNASQLSVFDLLADARVQIVGVDAYIGHVRDFWIARSHLDTALLAGSTP